MADVERTEQHRGPCACGKGLIVVERVEYSHMYGSSTSLDATITCSQCASTYEIDDSGTSMRRTSDVAKARKDWGLVMEKRKLIDQTWVAPIRTKIEDYARAQGRTKRQWYQALKTLLGPTMSADTYADFDVRVKRSGSFSEWVQHAISVQNIREVATQMGMLDAGLTHALNELAALEKVAAQPVTVLPLPPKP